MAMSPEEIARVEYHLKVILPFPAELQLSKGWWALLGPTPRIHDMLFGEENVHEGRVEFHLRSGHHGGLVWEEHPIFPLHILLEQSWFMGRSLLREMVLWNLLHHHADYVDVSTKRLKGGVGYVLTREMEKKPFWSAGERKVLTELFQLAGMIHHTSQMEFAQLRGYQKDPNRVLAKSRRGED